MRKLFCLVLIGVFSTNLFAAETKPVTKAETVAVEETAKQVAVKEMPANANGETAVRNVPAPESGINGFGRTEKPTVKAELPSLPKPGFFASLAIGALVSIALEVLKFLALMFVVLIGLKHFWPKAKVAVETGAAKIGAKTGTNIVGGVSEAVDKFDAILADLRDKHKAHSEQAALADSRLSKVSGALPAKKKANNG